MLSTSNPVLSARNSMSLAHIHTNSRFPLLVCEAPTLSALSAANSTVSWLLYTVFHSIPFHSVLFHSNLFYSTLFYSILLLSPCLNGKRSVGPSIDPIPGLRWTVAPRAPPQLPVMPGDATQWQEWNGWYDIHTYLEPPSTQIWVSDPYFQAEPHENRKQHLSGLDMTSSLRCECWCCFFLCARVAFLSDSESWFWHPVLF